MPSTVRRSLPSILAERNGTSRDEGERFSREPQICNKLEVHPDLPICTLVVSARLRHTDSLGLGETRQQALAAPPTNIRCRSQACVTRANKYIVRQVGFGAIE